MTTRTILSTFFLVGTCIAVAGAVTCESFEAPEACNGVVTDSGACFWNETTGLCAAGDKAEGMVAITSFEGESATDIQNGTFCTQEPETGNCRGMFPSWYYSAEKNSCDEFIYGGCGGNTNRFETGEACAAAAEHVLVQCNMAASIPHSVFVDPEWFEQDGIDELPSDEPISTSLEDLDVIDFSSSQQEFDNGGAWTDLGLTTPADVQ